MASSSSDAAPTNLVRSSGVVVGPIAPFVQTGDAYVIASGLVGVRRNAIGVDTDYRFAHWQEITASR